MAYNNFFQNQYQYPQIPYQYQPKMPGYNGQIIQVNGKAGADALQMEPNSSIYVQDSTQGNRIFLCITDGAGYKTVRGIIGTFEEEQEKSQQESIIASMESRIQKLEEIVNGYVRNDEEHKSKSAISTVTANN